MKFLDLFSGIGGFRLGLERAGHECVGYVEWDKYARKSYEAIHNTEGEWTKNDITTVTDNEWRELRGKVDIIAGGFPCQSFSIAGKREGFADKTKGTLFFEIARAAEQIKPQFLFLENVKGLLNHDKGNTFRTILTTLDELGYDAEWQLLNSKNFGVPQNRERVFIIGHLRNGRGREVFPIERSYGSFNQNFIKAVNDSKKIREHIGFESVNRFYDTEGISPCLNTVSGGGREPKIMVREATKQGYAIAEPGDSINFEHPNSKTRRGRVGKGVAQTLTTSCNQGVIDGMKIINPFKGISPFGWHFEQQVYDPKGITRTVKANGGSGNIPKTITENPFRIRKLTPLECWRLQGFPDSAYYAAEQVNSNSQLYKQAGNSVTVNVIEAIAKRF